MSNNNKLYKCEKGGYCIFVKAVMHKGDYKCKKCDYLLSELKKRNE